MSGAAAVKSTQPTATPSASPVAPPPPKSPPSTSTAASTAAAAAAAVARGQAAAKITGSNPASGGGIQLYAGSEGHPISMHDLELAAGPVGGDAPPSATPTPTATTTPPGTPTSPATSLNAAGQLAPSQGQMYDDFNTAVGARQQFFSEQNDPKATPQYLDNLQSVYNTARDHYWGDLNNPALAQPVQSWASAQIKSFYSDFPDPVFADSGSVPPSAGTINGQTYPAHKETSNKWTHEVPATTAFVTPPTLSPGSSQAQLAAAAGSLTNSQAQYLGWAMGENILHPNQQVKVDQGEDIGSYNQLANYEFANNPLLSKAATDATSNPIVSDGISAKSSDPNTAVAGSMASILSGAVPAPSTGDVLSQVFGFAGAILPIGDIVTGAKEATALASTGAKVTDSFSDATAAAARASSAVFNAGDAGDTSALTASLQSSAVRVGGDTSTAEQAEVAAASQADAAAQSAGTPAQVVAWGTTKPTISGGDTTAAGGPAGSAPLTQVVVHSPDGGDTSLSVASNTQALAGTARSQFLASPTDVAQLDTSWPQDASYASQGSAFSAANGNLPVISGISQGASDDCGWAAAFGTLLNNPGGQAYVASKFADETGSSISTKVGDDWITTNKDVPVNPQTGVPLANNANGNGSFFTYWEAGAAKEAQADGQGGYNAISGGSTFPAIVDKVFGSDAGPSTQLTHGANGWSNQATGAASSQADVQGLLTSSTTPNSVTLAVTGPTTTNGLVQTHWYGVLGTSPDGSLVKIFDPWGSRSNGSGMASGNGVSYIPASTFYSNFISVGQVKYAP